MTKHTQENVLTAEQLKAQGHRLTDMMTSLDMLKGYANALTVAKHSEVNTAVLLRCFGDFASQVYDQADQLYTELDKVAYHLLECDNPEELKAYGVTVETVDTPKGVTKKGAK